MQRQRSQQQAPDQPLPVEQHRRVGVGGTTQVDPQGRQARGGRDKRDLDPVDRAASGQHLGQARPEASALENTPVGQGGREPREKHEQVGGVAEPEAAEREGREPVAGDVVDEDEEEREAAKEINARVAPGRQVGRRQIEASAMASRRHPAGSRFATRDLGAGRAAARAPLRPIETQAV